VVIIAVGGRLCQTQELGLVQAERIRVSKAKIEAYELDIKGLQRKVLNLQAENCQLEELKRRVYVQTIVKVDSISLLPFDGKSEFFANETARIDTIRRRYLSRNN
jgi:hypothetical protein